MEILSLTTESFRNLVPGRVDFDARLNLVVGDNGQGKTNLLEALALVTGRPSFRTADLGVVRTHGAPRSVVSARVRTGDGTGVVGLALEERERRFLVENRPATRGDVARRLPTVFLTRNDLTRLTGAPVDRRRALDRAAAALHAEHGRRLVAYEKARASKSRLLASRQSFDVDELEVYESLLVENGAPVMAARREAAEALSKEIARRVPALGGLTGTLGLELVGEVSAEGTAPEIAGRLAAALKKRRGEERRAGRCLVGPHRDDVRLVREGDPVADRISSGENRTLLLAWTLAELQILSKGRGTTPLLAFDDFDSEWDPAVLAIFAEALPESGQIFLSSARPEAVRGLPLPPGGLFRMQAGRLTREGILGAGRRTPAARKAAQG